MEYGDYSVTAAEITEFAEKYDPQPFHVDEQAAEASMFGGLIASGWHTTAIWMRMTVDSLFSEWVALGSPGVDNIRWRRPTRPG
ncbi:MaoC/PaaZ C-terminal domain-containing protein [Haladaptatus sp. DYSN1]